MKTKTTIRKAFFILATCFSVTMAGQVFQKVGNGLGNLTTQPYGTASLTHNSDIYFGYSTIHYTPQRVDKSYVAKWNGLQWVQYPELPTNQISAIAVHQDDLYVAAGRYLTSSNVYRLDGNTWTPIFSTLTGSVNDLIVHNGHLICVGGFEETSTGNFGIVGYDGSNVVSYPSLQSTDSIADVNVINNELWVAGMMGHSGSPVTVNVKKLQGGTAWVNPATAHKPPSAPYGAEGVFEYNSKIYLLGYNQISEITNDTAYFVTSGSGRNYAEHNGMMYLANYSALGLFDGSNFSTIANAPQQTTAITSDGNYLYGFFNDTVYGGDKTYNHVFKSNSQYGLLSGRTYADYNGNCTFDPGTDQSVGQMRLVAQGNPLAYILSDWLNGTYQVALAPGTYNFSNITSFNGLNKHMVAACNNASGITIQANQTYTEDFVVQHDSTIDLETSFHPFIRHRARQGFTEGYTVMVKNPGVAITSPFDVKVTVPSSITLVNMTPQASSVNGTTYTFTFSGIDEREEKAIGLDFKIDLSANQIGDTLKFYSDITGVSNDAVPGSDKDTLLQRVVGACDPNDKAVNVERSLPGLESLDYHIRFQNVGTDTAYKVVIVDTLENYLDPASLVINASSHDYSFDMVGENILVWTFENILLPDSGANQMGSRGFVDFSIEVDPSLAIGDTIDNDAEIYFDYQPPVHTNHAKTAIVQWIGIEEAERDEQWLDVFPNPARNILNISNRSKEDKQLSLYDMTGKHVEHLRVGKGQSLKYSVDKLSAGVYLLKSDFGMLRIIVTE